MFEKEAEEIEKEAIKWVKDVFPNDEFKQSGISRALVEFAELGYSKANEWHNVKDELPPLNTNVLVIHKWHRTPEVGKRITVFPNCSEWVWAMCCDRYRYTSDDKNVIAWKEIVLPKEIEEND